MGTMVEESVEAVFVDLAAEKTLAVGVTGFLSQKTRVTTTSLYEARKKSITGFTALHRSVSNQFEAVNMVSMRVR